MKTLARIQPSAIASSPTIDIRATHSIAVNGRHLGNFTLAELKSLQAALDHVLIDLPPDCARVIDAVCSHFAIRPAALSAPDRRARIVWPRFLAAWLLRSCDARLTFHEIGRILNRDHGAIIHAVRAVQNRLDTDRAARADLAAIQAQLQNRQS